METIEPGAPPPEIPPALQAEGLWLTDEDGRLYGPLDLVVRPGEKALVIVQDQEILRRLMRCCLAFEKPESGRLAWWPGAVLGAGPGDRSGGAFFRQIGYVDRLSQLLHRWSLLDHLRFFNLYEEDPGEPDDGLEFLGTLGLAAQAAAPTENLPESVRRLSLYALALYQRPRLMLLERPFQFLEQNFNLVWGLIQARIAARELAVVVFDRDPSCYPPGPFHPEVTFALSRL